MFNNCVKFGLIFGLVLLLGFGNLGYADPAATPVPNEDGLKTDAGTGFDVGDNPGANGYLPRVGETLDYDLWVKSVIHGGKQTVKILSRDSVPDGNEVFHVQCTMKTIGLAYTLTKYSEVEDLILDGKGIYPLSIRREVHQGKTISIEKVEFDYKNGIATRSYCVDNGKIETNEIKLPGIVQDAVSLQFFLRKGDFQRGTNKLYYYENGTIDETSYNVAEGTTALKLVCGTYSKYQRIDHNGGKITVLVAQDAYRIPLIIRVLASFGKVEAKLIKIH
jgi:hypothetical protein